MPQQILYTIFKAIGTPFRTGRSLKIIGRDGALTERLSHKRECLYKDKITCLKSHLFVLEKAELTLISMLSKTKKVITTPPPVLCSVASCKLFYSTV